MKIMDQLVNRNVNFVNNGSTNQWVSAHHWWNVATYQVWNSWLLATIDLSVCQVGISQFLKYMIWYQYLHSLLVQPLLTSHILISRLWRWEVFMWERQQHTFRMHRSSVGLQWNLWLLWNLWRWKKLQFLRRYNYYRRTTNNKTPKTM